MYFLIQSNIRGDTDAEQITGALEELGIDYETIALDAGTEKIEVSIDRNDVFVFGSVKLARLARANTHWYPESFYGGNHLFEVYSRHYSENLLNYNTAVFELGGAVEWAAGDSKFIKPYKDAKVFTGKVFTQIKMGGLCKGIRAEPEDAADAAGAAGAGLEAADHHQGSAALDHRRADRGSSVLPVWQGRDL